MMTETLKLVSTKDGEQIAIWQIADTATDNVVPDDDSLSITNLTAERTTIQPQNILLTHGTFSDKQTCLRIAQYPRNLVIIATSWNGAVMVQAQYQKINLTSKPSQPMILRPLFVIYLMT